VNHPAMNGVNICMALFAYTLVAKAIPSTNKLIQTQFILDLRQR